MPLIKIASKGDSFRRCGRAFTKEGVVVDTAELSPGELKTLRAEPMLVIEPVAAPKGKSKDVDPDVAADSGDAEAGSTKGGKGNK